jgi:amphi-Trp domain-containing protein
MDLNRAVDYLQAVVNSLRQGKLLVQHADDTITLAPVADVAFQVKARQKGNKESVSLKISWQTRPDTPEDGHQGGIKITAAPAEEPTPAGAGRKSR